jgi:hypothetical protein
MHGVRREQAQRREREPDQAEAGRPEGERYHAGDHRG